MNSSDDEHVIDGELNSFDDSDDVNESDGAPPL